MFLLITLFKIIRPKSKLKIEDCLVFDAEVDEQLKNERSNATKSDQKNVKTSKESQTGID